MRSRWRPPRAPSASTLNVACTPSESGVTPAPASPNAASAARGAADAGCSSPSRAGATASAGPAASERKGHLPAFRDRLADAARTVAVADRVEGCHLAGERAGERLPRARAGGEDDGVGSPGVPLPRGVAEDDLSRPGLHHL